MFYLFNIDYRYVFLIPLVIVSYIDIKKRKIPNEISFFLIFIGVLAFVLRGEYISLKVILPKLIILAFILCLGYMKLMGGADIKTYIYLLLVLQAKVFILILLFSLLLVGYIVELKETKKPIIPIILICAIIIVCIIR